MEKTAKSFALGIVLDVISYLLAFLPFIVLSFDIKPYERGFFCDDDSIRYPYKNDTVTILEVSLIGILVPVAVIIVTETVQQFHSKYSSNAHAPYRVTSTCSIPHPVVCCYKVIGIFLFGNAVTQSITNIGKLSIGRLRPHFLDVCRPNETTYNCTFGDDFFGYVDGFVCTGTDESKLVDARMSFPSGHSSLSAFCGVFMVFYLQARFTWKGSKLLRHFIQALFIYAAVFVCLSRISDYKHHPTDVLAGAFLGSLMAALTSLHILNMYRLSDEVVEIEGHDFERGHSSQINISTFTLSSTAPLNGAQQINYSSTRSLDEFP